MIEHPTEHGSRDFSLATGGALFQIWRRLHLTGNDLQLVGRRIVVSSAIVWLPLLFLSLYEGHAFGGDVKISFLTDVTVYVRFLIALPILILTEVSVHRLLRPGITSFLKRNIIVGEEIPRFHAAIDSAIRIRDSMFIEIALLIFVYTAGLWIWRSHIASGAPSWFATPGAQDLNLTLAGYWFALVSIPFFQFILLRWYVRFGIWFWFLWRVSRLDLHLIASHPDRAGGLGFLGRTSYGFGPVLFAQGTLLAAFIANEAIHNGRNVLEFRVEAAGFIAFFVMVVLSPLLVFSGLLLSTKRRGLQEYGLFSSHYVQKFEDKWITGSWVPGEEFLGTGDIQSLADLGNSYNVIREMNLAPFVWSDALRLALAAAAPLLPLSLFIFSLDQIVDKIFRVLL